MKARGLGPLLVLVAATTLTASPVASAKPGYVTFPAERESQLTVKGTQGFQITIERIAGRVELTASDGSTSAIYVVHTTETPAEGIKATFPGRGKVSVRFDPSGRTQRWPGVCGGRAPIRQSGVFRGVIRFEGEQGFTRIVIGHARGFAYRSFKESCKGSKQGGSGATPIYSLTERAKSHGQTTVFAATKSTEGSAFAGSSHYFVSQWKRRHGMISIKTAFASTRSDTFAITGSPAQPESATVTPPSPFSGTANFHASPGELAEWKGTLAVDMPGVEPVRLTGPLFRPELCLGQRCVGRPHH